jgi:hypothetical protein
VKLSTLAEERSDLHSLVQEGRATLVAVKRECDDLRMQLKEAKTGTRKCEFECQSEVII